MNTRKSPDYSLYFVSAELPGLGRSHADTVRAAVGGGATIVQLRDKSASFEAMVSVALEVRGMLKANGVPLIINDRVDVALDVSADGLHIGQTDALLEDARRALGPASIIGVSVSTPAEARAAERGGADYLGVGPVYSTASKSDALPPIGLEGLREIRAASSLPIVAIGGVGLEQVAGVIGAGADGIAVISAITEAACMRSAAAALKELVRKSIEERSWEPSFEN
ncbi:MAG: thiamine phosphate synthase [Candidatus Aquicultorales bacterium]